MLIKSVMNALIYSLFIYCSIVNLLKLTFCWIKITAIINIKWSYLKWTNSIFKKISNSVRYKVLLWKASTYSTWNSFTNIILNTFVIYIHFYVLIVVSTSYIFYKNILKLVHYYDVLKFGKQRSKSIAQ